MEIILLLLFGLALFGVMGFLLLGTVSRGAKRSERHAEQILDQAFDGREDVSFPINMQSVKHETVIVGAKARGYKLVHESSNQYGPTMLMFEKV